MGLFVRRLLCLAQGLRQGVCMIWAGCGCMEMVSSVLSLSRHICYSLCMLSCKLCDGTSICRPFPGSNDFAFVLVDGNVTLSLESECCLVL